MGSKGFLRISRQAASTVDRTRWNQLPVHSRGCVTVNAWGNAYPESDEGEVHREYSLFGKSLLL